MTIVMKNMQRATFTNLITDKFEEFSEHHRNEIHMLGIDL